MRAFQLRFKESLMLRPHADVLSEAQAAGLLARQGRDDEPSRRGDGNPDGHASSAGAVDFWLDTHRGTKGGRRRLLPIDSDIRRSAIAYAGRVAVGANDSVADPRRELKPAIRRLRYVMERFGITLAGLKVTPHGLRHQGAAEQYEAITGEKPPIAGGSSVDPATDRLARREIARDLGHRRVGISNVYLGQPSAAAAKPGAAKTPVDRGGSPPTD
jgi:integrase